ncbi:Protein Dok-7, partial [Nibea albiflora]
VCLCLTDPSASQSNSEERLNHEAQELEKRLSMLSHRSSTVSSSYCPSAGGDDRSISGSSDTSDNSQSDCSIGSRLAIWTEPPSGTSENVGHAGAKAALQSGVEKVSVNQGGGNRPAANPPRQLQEIGRQSSSDSGIATGSHSSYSGSFSSYTGSLDITPGEDFGSLLQEAGGGVKDNEASTSSKDTPASSGLATDSAKGDKSSAVTCEGPSETTERQSVSEHFQSPSEESKKTKVAPSSEHPDSCLICSSKTIVTICTVCGGFKGTSHIPASASVIPAMPADQSADKSPCRPNTAAGYNILEKEACVSPGSGCVHSSEKPRRNEDSALPKKGREKLASLLADLLGFPGGDRQPEAKANTLSLYESMSPRFGNELRSTGTCVPSQDSQQDKRAAIYENCFKCQGQHCHPPPRVTPAVMYRNRNISTLQTFPTGLRLRKSQEHEVAANEELLYQALSDGSLSVDGQCQHEEMNGRTVTSEDKRLNSKEERRRADPAYEIMESRAMERNSEAEEKSKYELMGSCSQQRFLQETEEAAPQPLPERPRGEGATYVNIPVSPTSKKQLNYMELELQEPGPGTRGTVTHLPPQSK